MYQKFDIIEIEPILFEKRIIVTLSLDVDDATVTKESLYIGENSTGKILDYDIKTEKKTMTILLKEWPKPNVEYVIFIQKGIKSISEEELDAGVRRKITFDSDITSSIIITNPSDNEKISSVDIDWNEKIEEPGANLVLSYYIEISSDNAFYNLEKTSKVTGKQHISLTDVSNGQHFLRIRAENNEMYGRWSDVSSFMFSTNGSSSNNDSSGGSGSDQLTPITDLNVETVPASGITPATLVYVFDKYIDPSSIIGLVLKDITDTTEIAVTYTATGKTLMVTPTTVLTDNTVYELIIGEIKSIDGNQILENYTSTIMTAVTPMYVTIQDVNSVVGEFHISDDKILYYIHEASLMVNWIDSTNNTGATGNLTAPYDFSVVQFTKYKAARDALLTAYMAKASSAGSKGQLLDISFEFSGGTTGIKDLLKTLQADIMYWQEVMRGYGPEGRQKPLSAQRSARATPITNSMGTLKGSYDRSTPMNGGF